MMELKLYKAKVISLEDPDKKGRVQIRILPFMNEVKDTDLPWYDSLSSANPSETNFNPPKEGSIVMVLSTSNSFRRGYCLFPDAIEGFFNFGAVESALGGVTELSDTSYTNLRFHLYENGNISFYNRASGEHGIYHSSGSYTLFDSSGNVFISSASDLTLKNGSGTFEMASNGTVTINGNLEVLV